MSEDSSNKDKPGVGLKGAGARHLKPALLVIGAFYIILMLVLITGGESMPEVFPAPEFTTKDLLGPGDVTLSDFAGRPIIIYFFASW